MARAGLIITATGTVMAVIAAVLLLYLSVLIFTTSLLPALGEDQVALARASLWGYELSGWAVLMPILVYLLMGFVALALARRQGRRFLALWRAER